MEAIRVRCDPKRPTSCELPRMLSRTRLTSSFYLNETSVNVSIGPFRFAHKLTCSNATPSKCIGMTRPRPP